ncbi:MAG: PAS domain-containing protein [Planctomycetes bacterium]|nr:PAS domain-containing protein [Planctomycetota bacterium]
MTMGNDGSKAHQAAGGSQGPRPTGDSQTHADGPSTMPQEFHRRLCETVGVVLIAADPELKLCTWNGAATRIFGADARIMIGTPMVSIFPPDQRETARSLLRRAVDHGEVGQFEFRHLDPQERWREMSAIVSPVADENGKPLGASVCMRDITLRMKLEREVDRSRKLSSMGEMAGAMAHHFNNILGGIVTSVDFALTSDDARLQRRTLESTAKAVGRATILLESLLAFAEGVHTSSDLGDLTEIVLEVADQLEGELSAAGIELHLNLHTIPTTPVPRTHIQTVLSHLIHNSVDAMPGGGIINLELAPEGDRFRLTLRDVGCGIPAEQMERIFEPFFSTKSAVSDAPERNPGLGLSIVHGILQEIGAEISVDSTLGQGTTFNILLSAAPDPPEG